MTQAQGIPAALVRLSFLVQRLYAQACAEHDLSAAQAQLMCIIKDEPRGMTELTRMLGLERPGLTGLVDRIERRGLLSRESTPVDRRAVILALTPPGKQLIEAFYAEVSHRLENVAAHLPVADRQAFERIAGVILSNEGVPEIFGGPCPETRTCPGAGAAGPEAGGPGRVAHGSW